MRFMLCPFCCTRCRAYVTGHAPRCTRTQARRRSVAIAPLSCTGVAACPRHAIACQRGCLFCSARSAPAFDSWSRWHTRYRGAAAVSVRRSARMCDGASQRNSAINPSFASALDRTPGLSAWFCRSRADWARFRWIQALVLPAGEARREYASWSQVVTIRCRQRVSFVSRRRTVAQHQLDWYRTGRHRLVKEAASA